MAREANVRASQLTRKGQRIKLFNRAMPRVPLRELTEVAENTRGPSLETLSIFGWAGR